LDAVAAGVFARQDESLSADELRFEPKR